MRGAEHSSSVCLCLYGHYKTTQREVAVCRGKRNKLSERKRERKKERWLASESDNYEQFFCQFFCIKILNITKNERIILYSVIEIILYHLINQTFQATILSRCFLGFVCDIFTF